MAKDPRLLAQIEAYHDNVVTLVGEHPARSILGELTTPILGEGKTTLITSIDPAGSEDAAEYEFKDKATVEDYFVNGGGTFSEFEATLTPHTRIARERTISTPNVIEAGAYYQEHEFQYLSDPKNREVNALIQKVFLAESKAVARAISAPDVARYTDASPDVPVSVALPASQQLADMTYGDISVDTLPSAILEKMQDSWIAAGTKVYCAISSRVARELRKDTNVHSRDFVTNYADLFRTGGLPEIDGVTFVVLPTQFMSQYAGSGAIDTFFAWVPTAVAKVEYAPFEISTDVSPIQRFSWVSYLRKVQDFKRIDDRGVVVGDITS